MKTNKFYKFQAINKYSISSLIQRKSWYSKAGSLNDPFDIRVMKINLTDHGIQGFLTRKDVVEFLPSVKGPSLVTIKNELQKAVDNWGILCLTTKMDNLLMWAHYADMHRGICLEFEIDENFPGINKVSYQKDVFEIDSTEHVLKRKGVAGTLLTKSIDWAYEDEYRIININGGLQNYKGELTGVIFGARTPSEDKEMIKELLKNEVEYFESKLSESEFKVEII